MEINSIIEEIQENINHTKEYNDNVNKKEEEELWEAQDNTKKEWKNISLLSISTLIVGYAIYLFKLYNTFCYVVISVFIVVILIKIFYLLEHIEYWKTLGSGRRISKQKREARIDSKEEILAIVKNRSTDTQES